MFRKKLTDYVYYLSPDRRMIQHSYSGINIQSMLDLADIKEIDTSSNIPCTVHVNVLCRLVFLKQYCNRYMCETTYLYHLYFPEFEAVTYCGQVGTHIIH